MGEENRAQSHWYLSRLCRLVPVISIVAGPGTSMIRHLGQSKLRMLIPLHSTMAKDYLLIQTSTKYRRCRCVLFPDTKSITIAGSSIQILVNRKDNKNSNERIGGGVPSR